MLDALFGRPRTLPLLLLASLLALPASAQTVSDVSDDTVLKQITIFGRHGVRSPTVSPAD
jgi:hypothetical protein